MSASTPDRNLALELVRVTEAAALAAARWLGRGDKIAADQAAVDAMRHVLDTVPMDGVVVIGEGEKDEAPMLYNGEQIGDGSAAGGRHRRRPARGHDALREGHAERARGDRDLAARGTMFDPGPCVYMEKIAGGTEIADLLDLDRPIGETCALVAERSGVSIGDVMVVVLDRPRHEEGIEAIRDAGARVRLISDGDVSAALLAVIGPLARRPAVGHRRHARGRHLRRGDQVRSAAASSAGCGRATTRSARPRSTPATTSSASSPRTTSSPATTASSPPPASPTATCCRACATEGKGVATTESLVMRSRSGTVRRVKATHNRDKLRDAHRRALRLRAAGRRARHAARVADRRALGSAPGPLGSGTSPMSAKRPIFDSSRSSFATERRNPYVTSTWMRDCVTA